MKTSLKTAIIQGVISLPLLFLGPIFLTIGYKAWNHSQNPFILIIGIVLCFLAVFLTVKTIKSLMSSIFDK
ncbi:MAG: DUF6095 family protein [Flavobacteriaceae bacterium]